MRIELFTAAIIAVSVFVSISIMVTVTHAQLLQYIAHEGNNLTELCNQYLTMPAPTGEGLMQCVPYYNDTIKERLGIVGP